MSYDDAARAAAATTPLTVATRDPYVRATAQAIPALRWAPVGASTVTVVKPAKGEFKQAGSKVTISTSSANPGDVVCVALRSDAPVATLIADASGKASTTATLPAGDGTATYNVTDSGGAVATYVFEVLAKTKLKVKAPKVVQRGDLVSVRISGLARDESFKVFLDGKRVKKGVGTGKGSVKVKLRPGAPGPPQGQGRRRVRRPQGEDLVARGRLTMRLRSPGSPPRSSRPRRPGWASSRARRLRPPLPPARGRPG